jgi:hypothetical protein
MMKPPSGGKMKRNIMAITVSAIRPVAHLPLILGMLRKLEVATIIDDFLPPHPDNVLSGGHGVEALVLAILDGHHALYKVGTRLEERGMLSLLQGGLARESLNDYRLGQILDALFVANLNQVFGAIALKALAVYAIPTPWLHQDTTTIALYGAYNGPDEGSVSPREETAEEPSQPLAPRPAHGHSKDGRPDLKQVLLSLGVSGDGGLPLRLGLRDGNTSDSTETPVALEECLVLGLEGIIGIVADSKAYSQRTLGLCVEEADRVGDTGATHVRSAAGTGALGTATSSPPRLTRETWPDPPGRPSTLARPKCHALRRRGVYGWPPGTGGYPVCGSAFQSTRPARGEGLRHRPC